MLRRRRRQVQVGAPGSVQIQAGGSLTVGPPPADPELPCHGCAHSAAYAPFPGCPSGERPCAFCVRNPEADPDVLHPEAGFSDETEFGRRASKAGPHDGIWYGGTPAFKTPMDCYIATDRFLQQRIFDELNRLEMTGEEAPPREKFAAPHDPRQEIYCCDGGPAPGGHEWTCWGWLGISFG